MAESNPIEKETRQTFTIDIAAPVKFVWDCFVPDKKLVERTPDFKKIEFLTDQKEGIGTVTRWHTVGLVGRAPIRIEKITEYKRHEYYSYTIVAGDPPRDGTFIFLPIEGGTRVIFTTHFKYDVSDEELSLRRKWGLVALENNRQKAIKLFEASKQKQDSK